MIEAKLDELIAALNRNTEAVLSKGGSVPAVAATEPKKTRGKTPDTTIAPAQTETKVEPAKPEPTPEPPKVTYPDAAEIRKLALELIGLDEKNGVHAQGTPNPTVTALRNQYGVGKVGQKISDVAETDRAAVIAALTEAVAKAKAAVSADAGV